MKKSKKKSNPPKRSESEWQRLIARQKQSGLSQSAFCRREGLSLSSFQYWLYRDSEPKGELFTELTGGSTEGFEIESGGFRVKVPYNFQPRALRALLEVVRNS